jgi:hypothetical protein
LIYDEDLLAVGSSAKGTGFEGYEKMSKGINMFVGPSSTAEVLRVASFCIHHLGPGEVYVLYGIS